MIKLFFFLINYLYSIIILNCKNSCDIYINCYVYVFCWCLMFFIWFFRKEVGKNDCVMKWLNNNRGDFVVYGDIYLEWVFI